MKRGSSMIVTMWMVAILAVLALTFAHTRMFDRRGSENSIAALQAEQAQAGALRYVCRVLTDRETNNSMPAAETIQTAAVAIGNARFWLLGQPSGEQPGFGLVDEAGKLNINTASLAMLQLLPGMTAELAAAIIDWRDGNSDITPGGAESESYSRLERPYQCKNGRFETVGELALVYGMDKDLLYGKDRNLNGILDPWEEEVTISRSTPDLGWLDLLTVYSRESTLNPEGKAKINANQRSAPELERYIRERLGAKATAALNAIRRGGNFNSLVAVFVTSGLSAEDFARIDDGLTISDRELTGLVNVNTAPAAVLACIPGIGTDHAATLIAYRENNPDKLTSVAWVVTAIGREAATTAGPYITTNSYVFTADIVTVGANGRGYRRAQFVIDTCSGEPVPIYRRELSQLPWALGAEVREQLQTEKEN